MSMREQPARAEGNRLMICIICGDFEEMGTLDGQTFICWYCGNEFSGEEDKDEHSE